MNKIILGSRAPSDKPISLLGVAAITLPAALTYFDYASSFTMGTAVVAIFCLAVDLKFSCRIGFRGINLVFLAFISIILTLQVLIISLTVEVDLLRALLSLLIFAIFWFGAASFASLLLASNDTQINAFLRRAIVIILIVGILGGLGVLQPLSMTYSNSVFPYAEPSLYALVLIPVLAAASSVSTIRARYVLIGSAFVVLLLLKNLTLAVGIVLVGFLVLPLNHFLLGLTLTLPALFFLDLSYYVERLEFFEGASNNVSALVYLQGWQLLYDSFAKHYGFGIGYQQAGLNATEVDASYLIQALVGDNLNLKDGGFVFSKLVSELGFLSLLFLIPYIRGVIYSLKIIKVNKESCLPNQKPLLLFASCSVLCYSIELFVRGVGYFTPSSFLMLVGICIFGSSKKLRGKL
jgi:hypothetical protein